MGTPDYMAPEQTLDSHRVDIRADLYSLGCTLYHLLVGRPPFAGGTLGQKIAKHQSQDPVPVEQRRPEVPPGVAAVVRKLLAKRPEDRFQTPAELAAALAGAGVADGTPSAVPSTGPVARPGPQPGGDTVSPWSSVMAPAAGEPAGTVLVQRRAAERRRWLLFNLAGGGVLLGLVCVVGLFLALLWLFGSVGRRPGPAAAATGPRTPGPAGAGNGQPASPPPGGRAAEPGPAGVDRLIDQLADYDSRKREEARRGLAEAGEAALPALRRAAAGHADAEVRARADALGQQMEKDLRDELLFFGARAGGYWLNRVAFTPDGRQAVATGGAVILYDLSTGQEVNRSLELPFARGGLALTHDGRYFVTGHERDTVVRMGAVRTGKEVRTFEGHTDGVYAVALSPDDKRLVTGSNDKTLRLWDVRTGRELRQFPGVTDMVRSVDFSPDRRWVASGHYGPGSGYLVRLWDADAGSEVRSFQGHTREVTAVLFTPDGRSILSAGMDGAVILWEVETGKEVRRLAHAGGVYGAAVSPDGRRALTAGFGDRAVRLWDLATGRELRRLDGHAGSVLGVAFSPDGKRALSSDSQCTLRLWRLPD